MIKSEGINNTGVGTRKLYLDVCKGIAILMIVYCHIDDDDFSKWFSSFAVPIFFLVSGIIIEENKKYQIPFKEYAIKRLKAIMFPYVIFSALRLIASIIYILAKHDEGLSDLILFWAYDTALLRGSSALWFLPAIFLGELALYPLCTAKYRSVFCAATAVTGIAAMTGLNYLTVFLKTELSGVAAWNFIYTPVLTLSHFVSAITFLTIGTFVYRLLLGRFSERNVPAFIVAVAAAAALSFLAAHTGHTDISSAYLGEFPPIYFVTSVLMPCSLFFITRFICSFRYKFPVLSWCGKNSLLIMCTHLPLYIVEAVKLTAEKIIAPPNYISARHYAYYFTVLLIVMAIEFILVTMINKFFPWMTGKFKNKKEVENIRMKIFVTGVAGQLGHDVVNELGKRGIEAVGSDLAPAYSGADDNSYVTRAPYVSLDITDGAAVAEAIEDIKPDCVIHCAAWTAVDAAEDENNRAKVFSINEGGTKNIAEACKKIGAKMMYISTDYVFDGQGTEPWQPDCKAYKPLNVYGESKLKGELAVAETLEKYFIVRIAWVFGLNGKNFIKTMLSVGKTHDTVRVVNDQIGTPTYTFDLARLLVDMAQTEKYGYYHATNEGGYISWYDFTKEIYRQAGYTTEVIPVTTAEYGLSKAARPFNSRLDKSKLTESGFTPLPDWKDAVKRYLSALKA